MGPGSRTQLNAQVYEEACEWYLEFRIEEPDAEARSRFDGWLRRSPEHVAAYLEVSAIWHDPASHDHRRKWDALTLIEEAAAEPANLVVLPQVSVSPATSPEAKSSVRVEASHVRRERLQRRGVAFAACACIVVAVVCVYAWRARVPEYSTAVGEQRLIELADGSTIQLNARSRLVIRYTEQQRAVRLLAGEAWFRVAKDPSRPFTVDSGGARIRAVGTQFNINKRRGNTVVSVLEGQVAVDSRVQTPPIAPGVTTSGSQPAIGQQSRKPLARGLPETGLSPILLAAGEQLIIAPRGQEKPVHPDVSGATAWLRQKIVFDGASLTEVAEEFNRYSERQLTIEDSALNAFRVSGVFSSTDIGSLIRFIRERPGLRVIETSDEIRVRKNNS